MVLVIRNKDKELFNTLKKSLDNDKLNYFKNKLLAILSKKETEEAEKENKIKKAFEDIDFICMQKGRGFPVGTIKTWKGGKKFKKMPNGKWIRVYDKRNRSAEISIARLKGKVKRATSVEELFNIVSNNIHRFEDENGKTLDIVMELKAEVDKAKSVINKDKPKIKPLSEEEIKWNNVYKPVLKKVDEYLSSKGIVDLDNIPNKPYLSKKQEKLEEDLFDSLHGGRTSDTLNTDKYSYDDLHIIMDYIDNLKLQNAVFFKTINSIDYMTLYQYNDLQDDIEMVEKLITNAKNWNKKPKEVDDKLIKGKYNNIDYNSLPNMFKATPSLKKTFQTFCKKMNDTEIKDDRVRFIYQNFGNAVTNFGSAHFEVKNTGDKKRSYCSKNEVVIPKLGDINNLTRDSSVIVHEFTHKIDYNFDGGFSNLEMRQYINKLFTHDILDEVNDVFKHKIKELPKLGLKSENERQIIDGYEEERKEFYNKMKEKAHKLYPDHNRSIYDFQAYNTYMKKKMKEYDNTHEKYNEEIKDYSAIDDILDALSGGEFFTSRRVKAGHGKSYFSSRIRRAMECIAEYMEIKVFYPDQEEVVKRISLPLYNLLEKMIDRYVDTIKKHINK